MPWLLTGGINFISFAAIVMYLLQLDDGLFTDIARSAVIKAYALLAIVWTALLGYVISLAPKLTKRTGAPVLRFILLLAGLDFAVVTAFTPGIWIALIRSNPYWSGGIWGWRDLVWLIGSTAISGALYWTMRNRTTVSG
ncbi:hypothetical protein [Sphingomonas edaphi]|nr:hypothetical protein [Sphingomonas edaphi]